MKKHNDIDLLLGFLFGILATSIVYWFIATSTF